jgi:hypothetical protein
MSDTIAEAIYEIFQLLIKAWFVMLLLGGIHSRYHEVPALGFGVTVMATAVIGLLVDWRRFEDVK